jgi:hypothetical protein
MAELGKAYVQIIPSMRGIKGELESQLGGAGASAGKSAGSKIGSAIKTAIVSAGIIEGVKMAVSQGAELEQNLGGTEVVFGHFAQSVQNSATEAYKNMGLSASNYMATANKMGSLFQGSGLEQERAMDLTTKAMQRAADVASVMGIDTEAAMESIAGAAKGNFTMMDNLGVAMNATTLEAYALEKGVNFKWNTASNAEKAELAMQMFFEKTAQYEGNFAKEAEQTIAGSLSSMGAAFSDLLGNLALGRDIAPSLTNLANSTFAFLENNLIPAIINIMDSLPEALPKLVSSLVSVIVRSAPKILEAAGKMLIGLVNAIPPIIKDVVSGMKTMGTQLVQGLWNGILNVKDWVLSKIKGFGQSILNGIKDIFSIHSPSRETEWMGEMLSAGLARGIVGGLGEVEGAMDTLGTATLAGINPAINGGAVSGRTTNVGGISVNVYGAAGQNVKELAEAVMYELQHAVERRGAVFA